MMKLPRFLLFSILLCTQVHGADNKTFLFNKERNKFHVMTTAQAHNTSISSEASETSVESDLNFLLFPKQLLGNTLSTIHFQLLVDIILL